MEFLLDNPVTDEGARTNAVACLGKQLGVIVQTANEEAAVYVTVEVSNDNQNFAEFPLTWRWDTDDNSNRPAAILTRFDSPLALQVDVSRFRYVRLAFRALSETTATVTASYRVS